MNRFEHYKTKEELISSLQYIFPIISHEEIDETIISESIKKLPILNRGKRYLFWSEDSQSIIAIIYDSTTPQKPHCGISLKTVQKPQPADISFGNYFNKVFNIDIITAPNYNIHAELWHSLRQNQFRRAIVKFSSFRTDYMLRWMQTIENSISLRYENKPFSFCLLMTKRRESITIPFKDILIPLKKQIPFSKGILSEKWIRAALSDQNIGIAAYSLFGGLFSLFTVPYEIDNGAENFVSPHDKWTPTVNLLDSSTCMFIATENGDIYLLFPNKVSFYKTQGRWHYINHNNTLNILITLFPTEIASAILRLCLNLAYEKHGALILIPDTTDNLNLIIPDYNLNSRINSDLRDSVKGLKITNKVHQRMIISSAKIDGALVITQEGIVQDAACIVGQPSREKLEEYQISRLERYSGARTTAAWNASLFGTAIKISEDGPISIFRHGILLVQIG